MCKGQRRLIRVSSSSVGWIGWVVVFGTAADAVGLVASSSSTLGAMQVIEWFRSIYPIGSRDSQMGVNIGNGIIYLWFD